ncbi:Type 1 glutamine amidotransferase-like domain-containing protein [Microlunatus parietis]|uniref:Cyanophycinase-like exopeptidase n=1 Tax=Microlunatus parietis TaxID=682979 RepID=A0A7Y9LBX7_9ACTN|nr:Type 1 glutamine amidotransferase-like domain-containing protein [Microlunatus parietis]NYE71115.1 cyanophycinase-like exopeptidase [Microlunatus parietis]
MTSSGRLFLYSTSPAPHEAAILAAVPRAGRADDPIRAVALRTAQDEPSDHDLETLAAHFTTQPGFPVLLVDSGLGSRADAFDPAVLERLAEAELILISGGSPTRLVTTLSGTPALAALQRVHRGGAVVAGCSAGAAVVGIGMIDFGRPLRTWGWLPGTLVAPHFGQFDHRAWLRAYPGRSMVGIPDGAMVRVAETGEITGLGSIPLVHLPGVDRDAQ